MIALATATGCSGASIGSHQTVTPTETVCPGNSTNVSIPQFDGFGGQRTPIAAAVYFSRHGNVGDVPSTGWQVTAQTKSGAYLRSGASIIHTVHASDGTWLVDHESTCRS
jgi:hypothetical protein